MLPFSLALAQMRQECFNKRYLVYACRALDKDLESVPVGYRSDLCILLPAIFKCSALKSDFIHMGILIIDRLGIHIDKAVNMTYDCLPEKTLATDIINIGLVLELESGTMNRATAWKIDWSAFAYSVKAQDSMQADDGIGTVTSATQSHFEKNSSQNLQAGDMICHIQMVRILLLYRRITPEGKYTTFCTISQS